MAPIRPFWIQPSHPLVLKVIHAPGSYAALSRSQTSLPPGALVATLDNPPLKAANKAYSTVQVSCTEHVELNCDFLYINHACEPSLEFHVMDSPNVPETIETKAGNLQQRLKIIEVRVAPREDANGNIVGLKEGDEMTFFYPSTEWEMTQPFDCICGARNCMKRIAGAKGMEKNDLRRFFINDHIQDLLGEQERMRNGISAGLNINDKKGLDASKARRGSSARALAGEMGGDTKYEILAT